MLFSLHYLPVPVQSGHGWTIGSWYIKVIKLRKWVRGTKQVRGTRQLTPYKTRFYPTFIISETKQKVI